MSHEKTSETKKHADAKTLQPQDVYKVPFWLKIIGPVLGTIAAAGTAFFRIGDEYYNKIKTRFGVRELSELRDNIANLLTKASSNHLDAGSNATTVENGYFDDLTAYVNAAGAHPDTTVGKGIAALEKVCKDGLVALQENRTGKVANTWILQTQKVYTEQWKEFLESSGIRTKGWKRIVQGTIDRLPHIGNDTRLGILFYSLVSAGAVIASLFMLNLNTRLRLELRDIHGKLGDLVPGDGGDAPEKLPVKDTALALENLPRSKVDTQDVQHERLVLAQPEQQRA